MARYWIVGTVFSIVAAAALYGSAALAKTATGPSVILLIVCLLAGFGIFRTISIAFAPDAAQEESPEPWRGTLATVGVLLVGLVALFLYIGTYVAGVFGVSGFLTLPAVLLTFLALILVVMLTGGKVEGEGERHDGTH